MGNSQIWVLGPSAPAAAGVPVALRPLRKLMVRPSGDHSGWDSPRSEKVNWRAGAEPSAATIQMCERISGGLSPLPGSAFPPAHSHPETV